MGDRVLVGGIRGRREVGVDELAQSQSPFPGTVHADEPCPRRDLGDRLADATVHLVGVDEHARLVIGQIPGEVVGELQVDGGEDRPDPPSAEHDEQVLETVVGEDRHPVARPDPEGSESSGHPFGGDRRLAVGEDAPAIDPAERRRFGTAGGVIEQELVHEHGRTPWIGLRHGEHAGGDAPGRGPAERRSRGGGRSASR